LCAPKIVVERDATHDPLARGAMVQRASQRGAARVDRLAAKAPVLRMLATGTRAAATA
jgi:hypothetical protein